MDNYSKSLQNSGNLERNLFLLTKPTHNDRTRLCFKMIENSSNATLYLMGDGVYNLMSKSIEILPSERIFACKEDTEARGIRAGKKATILAEFYEHLAENIMDSSVRVYTF